MPDFMAMFPYMAAMIVNAQGMVAKKGKCEYFDVHGYCMRGDACAYEHTKQTPDIEARHEVGRYASDTERSSGVSRKKAQFTLRLPSMANTSTTRNASRTFSYEMSPTPDDSDDPKTPQEIELNNEAFKAEQIIKQQDHKTRVAILKDEQSQMEILARKAAEMEVKLAAEKAKLMGKPGGDKILAQISAEGKRNSKLGTAGLAQRAVDDGTEADIMSLGGTPDPRSRRLFSVLSDTGGYKGKNQAIYNFFPNCTNPTCTFKHTADSLAIVMLCKFFPNCTNRDCTFKHTTAGPISEVLCKFFPNCTKQDCTFKHPTSHLISNVQCKYHPNCTNAACTLKHGDGGMAETDCKYYPDCTNPHCGFRHPEGSTRAGGIKRVDNRPRNLLISGVSVSFNNSADAMNMVRVAFMGIAKCETIQLQSLHDPRDGDGDREEEAHDGLVVTFAERWQAEEVRRRLTMVGGMGRVKYAWYLGSINREAGVGGTPRTELEVDVKNLGGGDGAVNIDDVKIDGVRIKDEDLDVAGEDDEWAHIS